jgi:hypothetical protein
MHPNLSAARRGMRSLVSNFSYKKNAAVVKRRWLVTLSLAATALVAACEPTAPESAVYEAQQGAQQPQKAGDFHEEGLGSSDYHHSGRDAGPSLPDNADKSQLPWVEACSSEIDPARWYGDLLSDPAFPQNCDDDFSAFCPKVHQTSSPDEVQWLCGKGTRREYEQRHIDLARAIQEAQKEDAPGSANLTQDYAVPIDQGQAGQNDFHSFFTKGATQGELQALDKSTIRQLADVHHKRIREFNGHMASFHQSLDAVPGAPYDSTDGASYAIPGSGQGLLLDGPGDSAATAGTVTSFSGSGRRSWRLINASNDRKAKWFNVEFSFGVSSNMSGDGKQTTDISGTNQPPAQGQGGIQEQTASEQNFSGLEVKGDLSLLGWVFQQQFTIARASLDGKAFSPQEDQNKLVVRAEIVGVEVYRREWSKCNKPDKPASGKGQTKNVCKQAGDQGGEVPPTEEKKDGLKQQTDAKYHFSIGPVPLEADWHLVMEVSHQWNANFDFYSTGDGVGASLGSHFNPAAISTFSMEGSISILGQKAGAGGNLTLVRISPAADIGAGAKLGVNSEESFTPFACAYSGYDFLSGSVYAFAEVHFWKWKKRWSIDLASWEGFHNPPDQPWQLLSIKPDACPAPSTI